VSWVANVMLSVDRDDRPNAEEFSRWLEEDCPPRDPDCDWLGCGGLALTTNTDTQWGGTKYPECSVYAGVLNHADLNAVVRCFGSLGWHRPGIAQLFLMDQEEFSFQVWMIRHVALRQYAPPEEEDYPFLNLPTQ